VLKYCLVATWPPQEIRDGIICQLNGTKKMSFLPRSPGLSPNSSSNNEVTLINITVPIARMKIPIR
jgi:hypothetical protein